MDFINYGQHYVDSNDLKLIKKSLFSKKITQGEYVLKFEKKLSKIYGSKYSVAVNNGTAALILAIKALKLKNDSKIITTPITFLSSATSIILNGLKPVFSDISRDTFTIDVLEAEKKIKKDRKIRAIVAVDYAGHPCDWDFIKYLKKKYNIFTINDNCHSLGSKMHKSTKYACKYADLVTQSFHPVKHFTTGEGGAILTNNKTLFEHLKISRNHGILRNNNLSIKKGLWFYNVIETSHNFRISDINCALGLSQINKLKKFISKRRQISNYYKKRLSNIRGINLPIEKKKNYHSYHLYPVRINFNKFKVSKKFFFLKMLKKKIVLQVHYIPLYYHKIFKKYKFDPKHFPNAENFYKDTVSLPIYYNLTFKQCDYIVKSLKKVLKIVI